MWLFYVLISAASWGFVNILDSLLVRHYEKNPFVLMWSQALFSISLLFIGSFFLPIHSTWKLALILIGMSSFIGDLYFFYVLERLDISVVNGAWAIQSIYLSLAGFFLFHEIWTLWQLAGAILVIAGVLMLSFWNQHISLRRTLLMLIFLGLLYSPNYVVQKAAFLDHQSVLAVFFWTLIGRESCSLLVPCLFPSVRQEIRLLIGRVDREYFLISGMVIVVFFLAVYCWSSAYAIGNLSLVAIAGNTQPFFVIFLAWLFYRLLPKYAPKENVGRESVRIKIISFIVAFFGLALLSVS